LFCNPGLAKQVGKKEWRRTSHPRLQLVAVNAHHVKDVAIGEK